MKEIRSLSSPGFPPELRLILACLRSAPDPEEVNRMARMIRAQISWPEFLWWVDRHRVAPLVYENLRRHSGAGVPAPVMAALRSRWDRNTCRSLANAGELVRLARLFKANGVAFLPLKGSVLALQAYGGLARRPTGDIDLLVAPEQIDLADRLLQASYRRQEPAFRLTACQRRRFLRLNHHFGYVHEQNNFRVELHWQAIHHQSPAAMDPHRLLRRASTVQVAGSPLPALSLLDNILYLCGHGGVHFWCRLFWLADLAEIIRANQPIDWRQLLAVASESGMVRSLALGVILAQDLLEAPVPESFRTQVMHEPMLFPLAELSYRFALCPQPDRPPFYLHLRRSVCRLRCADSFQGRLNILQEIFSAEDWQTAVFPDSLYFLYYLCRFPFWLRGRLAGRRNRMVRKGA